MSTELANRNSNGSEMANAAPIPRGIEKALITGDLSDLTADQRLAFYNARCEAAGLDPRTQPFEYVTLKGKLTLYAKKGATDQLIAMHNLSVKILRRGFDPDFPGAYSVECQVSYPHGQTVEDVGVVWIPERMTGDDLCNAIMKAISKSKRRTVLSACGLGMLDESEIDSIPHASVTVQPPRRPELQAAIQAAKRRPEPTPEPSRTAFGAWLDDQLAKANDAWREAAQQAGVKVVKPVNRQLIGNHIVKVWMESGELTEADIQTDGKRDNAKVAAKISEAFDANPDEIRADVEAYINAKLRETAKQAGIAWPDAAEPEDAAPGEEVWEDGRE